MQHRCNEARLHFKGAYDLKPEPPLKFCSRVLDGVAVAAGGEG